MSFKPKMVFKFDDGENVEITTLIEGYDFKFVDDFQKAKKENGTLHLGHAGHEVSKSAKSLKSIEIILD